MANLGDISKIKLPNGNVVNIKDATVRAQANWNTNNGVKNFAKTNTVTFERSTIIDVEPISGLIAYSIDNIVSSDTTYTTSAILFEYTNGQQSNPIQLARGQKVSGTVNAENLIVAKMYLYASTGYVASGGKTATFTNVMITPKSLYDADSTYEPYALPNTKITPELIELVDSGAKNKFKINPLEYQNSLNGLTLTWDENAGSVTVTGTMTDTTKNAVVYLQRNINGADLSGMILYGGLDNNNRIILQNQASPYNNFAVSAGTGVEIPANTATVMLYCFIPATSTAVKLTFKPMICTKAAWDVSQKYVPYRPTYEETVEQVTTNKNNILLTYQTIIAIPNISTSTIGSLTHSENVGTITINGTSGSTAGFIGFPIDLASGTYKLSGCPSGGSNDRYSCSIRNILAGSTMATDYGDGATFTLDTAQTVWYNIRIAANYTANNVVFKPLINQ